jgi:hypothetical protein
MSREFCLEDLAEFYAESVIGTETTNPDLQTSFGTSNLSCPKRNCTRECKLRQTFIGGTAVDAYIESRIGICLEGKNNPE